MVRKGNEALLAGHPFLHEVIIWDKKENKIINLFRKLQYVRKKKYEKVINVQRFAATGLLTAFSAAGERIGFDKNPFSFLFDKKIRHVISDGGVTVHEIQRNNDLIRHFTDDNPGKPRLYPSVADAAAVAKYKKGSYICITPASVWFTKQYPPARWISFLNKFPLNLPVYLLGAPGDASLAEEIRVGVPGLKVVNLCGQLTFLQSASLMKGALMNYVNDSAPMHFASAVNAPVSAVYCSTIPEFGFGPLSDQSFIIERQGELYCRPCGLHGYKACPEGHFRCAFEIADEQLLATITLES